jgi:GntR family transcriptional regulator, transcriptional repressor for pyruvate dehydrogenase complex
MITPKGEVRRVAEVVLGRILDGTYPRDLRLPPEASLAEELGCGRSTLREALRHLADLGLVQSRRGSGAMVRDWRREGTPPLLPAYVRAGRFDVPPARLAREMLRLRTLMATEAVRLAARYASPDDLSEARARLAAAPVLEADPAAHALNELELYRALVAASRIYPAAWMVNAFWSPLRELNALIAPLFGQVEPDFQATMVRLLELVSASDEEGAVAHIAAWFARVDARLGGVIETVLAHATFPSSPPGAEPVLSVEPTS